MACKNKCIIQNHSAVNNIEWSDSRRVDCVQCKSIHHIILYCRMAYKNKFIIQNHSAVNNIKWSDSRRVDCVPV